MRNNIGISLLLAATACTGDIGGGDDTTDPVVPPATDIQLTVRDGTMPQANVRVLFQNTDQSIVAEVLTDANGVAIAEMAGGNITVIRMFPPIPPETVAPPAEVFTYLGAKAGDRLELGRAQPVGALPNAINVTVPEGTEGTVTIMTQCGTGTGTGPLIALSTYNCPAMVDFYVSDNNSSLFKATAFSENINLSMEPLLGNLASTIAATNIPADTNVNAEQRIISTTGYTLYTSGNQNITTTPQTVDVPAITGVDELIVAEVQGQLGQQMFAMRRAYEGNPVVVDPTSSMIKYVTGQPDYSPTGISWTEEGTGTADAVVIQLDVSRITTPGLPATEFVRTIIAPHPGSPILQMPLLPGAFATYNAIQDDQVTLRHGIVKATGGYDALRARAFAVTNIIEATPANGVVTLSYTGTPPGAQ